MPGPGPVPFVPLVAPDDFRADFPAFGDAERYTDDAINFWIGIASLQLSQRWSTKPGAVAGASGLYRSIRDLGVCCFVAHQLTVDAYVNDQAQNGAPPTGAPGIVSSRGVGPASVSYDVASTIDPKDQYWNLSVWGRRFAWMARLVGSGPIQLGIGIPPPFSLASGGGWWGPYPFPGWFSS